MGHSKRKENDRNIRRIVLIVCEGKTEENYFNKFRKRDNGVKIITFNNKKTDPNNLIKDAKKQIDKS